MSAGKQIERFRKAYERALECKWKGGTASITSHLKRRKKRGHLSESATETELIAQAESVQETTTMQTGLDCVALTLQTQFCRRTLQ